MTRTAHRAAGPREAAPAISLRARLPERGLDVDLAAPPGVTTALIGPNGAGKSSTVAVLSGFLRPASARVAVGERVLVDTDPGSRTWVPPHQRGIVQLVQQPLLFPTMSVLDNVAFGLRTAGVGRARARARSADMLERVGAGDLGGARPAELSGGQAQRAAIARALVTDPAVLLLDEPLAQLDGASAARVLALLGEALAGRTALLISHDPAEVRALAAHIVVLEAGRVAQSGAWEEIAAAPETEFARRFTADGEESGAERNAPAPP
ncbi:ATP-binding cassette domain-containing protein [Brevibacterium ihuae]|uniref:ATP-binding cassette domain-containing protein n=1 Tax=Brevibacterium ihuae TaxID=1631743 RepID=UPI000C77E091|nr:ATP-binding cassette domain-containing protein [Brevibacterium ihuae]